MARSRFLDPLNPAIDVTPPLDLDPPNSHRAYRDLVLRALMPSQPSGYVDGPVPASRADSVGNRQGDASPPGPAAGSPSDGEPTQSGGQAPTEIATGAFRREPDPQASALIDSMIRSGATDDQIYAALKAVNPGATPLLARETEGVRETLKANPNYKGAFAQAVREVPQTLWNRFVGSPPGAFGAGYLNAATAGLLDEGAGTIDSIVTGRNIHDAIADYDAKKLAVARANPLASTLGSLVGGVAGGAKFGKVADGLLEGTKLAARLGKATPWVGDLVFGGLGGAGDSNDNRLGGALTGAALGVGGRYGGELAAIPVGALARSKPGSAAVNLARKLAGTDPLGHAVLSDPTALRPTRALGLFGGAAAGATLPYVMPYVPELPLQRERPVRRAGNR